MTCLNLSNGFFSSVSWSSAPSTNTGNVTVTRTATQITVQRAGQTGSVNAFGDFSYAVFGDLNFVALLRRQDAGASNAWSVSMVDVSGPAIGSTFLFSRTIPTTQSPPRLESSPVNGRLAFFSVGTGTLNQVGNLMIVRSDNGAPVLSVPGNISSLTNVVSAQITATELIIHHPNSGSNDDTSAPRPAGQLTVSPSSQDFGEAVLGAADPSLATVTRTFTLGNSGNDCITVSAIGNDPPFSVAPSSLAQLPIELDPGQTASIDVLFQPTSPANNAPGSLMITRTPANGASALQCQGDARNAIAAFGLSRSSIAFGTIPHPSSATESFSILNSGELDLTVTISSPPAGSSFSWTPVGTIPLPFGGTQPCSVTFSTPGDLPAPTTTIDVTAAGVATPRQVTLSGAGCVPNAVPILPTPNTLTFGDVERGFRTVRLLEVVNAGDGDLSVTARIVPAGDPAHASLFGIVLPDNDITDAPDTRGYSVLPVSRCGAGPTGTGRQTIAVSFHADLAPAMTYVAQLDIDAGGTTRSYELSANITEPTPIDAVLVFDKSGSMDESAGSRAKIEAARAAGELFVQMLREDADDRAAIVAFNEDPDDVFPIEPVAGNKGAMISALGFSAGGATNIAGGVIVAGEEFDDPPHPSNPASLKKAVITLTDGMENIAYQIGGAGEWYSITGRDPGDPPDGMWRPDMTTPQESEALPTPPHKVYGIAIGDPALVDGAALDALSTATGASFDHVVDMTGDDYFLLEKYFTQIFMETAGLSPVLDPFYTIAPGTEHVHEFDIFPGDVNTMVVVFDHPAMGRLPFHLVSPQGETISGTQLPPGFGVRIRSTSTARFVEVTFPRGEPKRYVSDVHDRWKVVVRHDGRVCFGDINPPRSQKYGNADEMGAGFQPFKCRETKQPIDYGIAIGAGSNLRMQAFVEPGTKLVNDPIRLNATLAEAGLPLSGANVRVTIDPPSGPSTTLDLRDDGASGDGSATDGDYGGVFDKTMQAGVYRFLFRAQGLQAGRPYVRELHRTKTVYDRRTPPRVGKPGNEDCRKLLRLIEAVRKKGKKKNRKRPMKR